MAWMSVSLAVPGQFLLIRPQSGWNFDLFSGLTDGEIMDRIAAYASGWHPVTLAWDRGIAGMGADFRLIGRVDAPLDPTTAAAQFDSAMNSFWTVAGVQSSVLTGDNASEPAPSPGVSEWPGAIKWASLAVTVLAIAVIVWNLRKGLS